MKETLERIDTRLDSIDVTLTKQAKDIEHHIKRTDILERDMQPIRETFRELIGVLKFLGFASVLATIYEALRSFFS